MVRHDESNSLVDSEFRLTLRQAPSEYPMALCVSSEDTVGELKAFMETEWERYADEMTLIVNRSYPYPLPDDMRLGQLLPEHRDLILRVHEGGEEEESEKVWWATPIPMRYLQRIGTEERNALDLRYLPRSCISRIRSWIYQTRVSEWPVTEVWLLGTHPCVMEMLYAVAEDVLSLTDLRDIILFHPEQSGYIIPPLSTTRHNSLQQESGGGDEGVWVSHLQREGLVYLYQHLALDRYRDSVEIKVKGGLLSGWDGGQPWRP